MHLQHSSSPVLPLESHFKTFWLSHVQKSKFWYSFCRRKWPMSLGFSIFEVFFVAFPFSPFLFFLLQWLAFYWACLRLKTSKKASSRRAIFTMEQPGVVAGSFALSFWLNFLSIFVHISGSIRPGALIWALLERRFPPAQVDFGQKGWRQKWKKGWGSSRPVVGGSGVDGLKERLLSVVAVVLTVVREVFAADKNRNQS